MSTTIHTIDGISVHYGQQGDDPAPHVRVYEAVEHRGGELAILGYDVEARGATLSLGMQIGRPIASRISADELGDAIALAAQQAASIDAEYAAGRALWSELELLRPVTRAVYEAECARRGLAPRPDDDCSPLGDYDYLYPNLVACRLTQLRAFERDAEARRAPPPATPPVMEPTGRVLRRYTKRLPMGAPDLIVIGSEAHAIVSRRPAGVITDDCPSIDGSHLLHHEGERSERVDIEVRAARAV